MKSFITFNLVLKFLLLASILSGNSMLAQPANDLIENAIDLGSGPIPYSETTVNFPETTNTNDNTPAGTGCQVSQPAVWYKFTATKVGTVTAGILNPNGAVIIFFTGPANGVTSGMQLTHVDQGNNPCAAGPLANIQTTIGSTYYIYMRNTIISDVAINTSTTFQVPENDLIENAIDLAQETIPYIQDNIHMLMATNTNDGGQAGCPSGATSGIWYKITPSQPGQLFALIYGTLGTVAGVFYSSENPNATSGTELTWIDHANNPCGPNGEVMIEAEAGLTYYLMVGSLNPYLNLQIDVSSVLSISDITSNDFQLYPNPVIDELKIDSQTAIEEVKIFSLTGQQVYSQKINGTEGSLFLSSLKPALYLLEITSEGKKSMFRILKN